MTDLVCFDSGAAAGPATEAWRLAVRMICAVAGL
jgi:hypothetical protein